MDAELLLSFADYFDSGRAKFENIKINLSISDDFPWAIAFVIISREI